ELPWKALLLLVSAVGSAPSHDFLAHNRSRNGFPEWQRKSLGVAPCNLDGIQPYKK
ncbi:hypothetical protein ACHAWF_012057, partial [Thalassiosira exigua]